MLTCSATLLSLQKWRAKTHSAELRDTGLTTDEEIRGHFDATHAEINRRFDRTRLEVLQGFGHPID